MDNYQHIHDAHADLRAGKITQQQLDRIVSRQHQYLVTVPMGNKRIIKGIYGSALLDSATLSALSCGGEVHHVCCYGHAFSCGGTI